MVISGKASCTTCGKERAVWKCEGCLASFCDNHVLIHRQDLNRQFEDVEITCDLLRQTLTEQTSDVQKHALKQKIDQWEKDSIEKIRRTAEQTRQLVDQYTIGRVTVLEAEVNKLVGQLKQSRQENDYYETDLCHWKDELTKLQEQVSIQQPTITLRQGSTPLVNKISLDVLGETYFSVGTDSRSHLAGPPDEHLPIAQRPASFLKPLTRWIQNATTIAGGHGSGNKNVQLFNPLSICVHDDDQVVYIADYWNNRIVEWKWGETTGHIAVGETVERNWTSQLNCPRDVILDREKSHLLISDIGNRQVVQWARRYGIRGKTIISDIDCWGLAMDHDGYLYVSDCQKHEVRRWRLGESNGTLVAGGHGQGNRSDQLNYPTYICVDHEQSVFVSDRYNHRVMKWTRGAKEGLLVAGNQTEGASLSQLSYPSGIAVDQLGNISVAGTNNHRIIRWSKGATKGSVVVGGKGHGEQPDQLYNPWGLSFDRQGNLYVADNANHRVQKFTIDSGQI